MKNWNEWKIVNSNNIAHPVGFEERFVDSVLSKIDLIKPIDVISQYPFIDHNGKQRYIDFVIKIRQNDKQQFLLPIELDGKTKFDTYESFNDTLERQNDLLKKFNILLRYSNKKMLNQPDEIISEICAVILQIQQKQDTLTLQQKNLAQYLDSVSVEISNLKDKLSEEIGKLKEQQQSENLSNKHHQQSLNALLKQQEQKIEQLTKKLANIEKLTNEEYKVNDNSLISKKSAFIRVSGVLFLLMCTIIISVIFFVNPSDDEKIVKKFNLYENSEICGKMVEIRPFNKGIFLNFDDKYPNQAFSALILDEEVQRFDSKTIKQFLDQEVCILGKIEKHNGHPQILIKSLEQISRK